MKLLKLAYFDMTYFSGLYNIKHCAKKFSFEKTEGRPYFWCLEI